MRKCDKNVTSARSKTCFSNQSFTLQGTKFSEYGNLLLLFIRNFCVPIGFKGTSYFNEYNIEMFGYIL